MRDNETGILLTRAHFSNLLTDARDGFGARYRAIPSYCEWMAAAKREQNDNCRARFLLR